MKKYKYYIIGFIVLVFLVGIFGTSEEEDPNIIKIGTSSSSIVGENYETIVSRLEKRGFTNIEVSKIEDLILGWFTKDGEIESIEIDGITEFSSDSKFAKDTKILIVYHTFPERNTNNENPNIDDEDPDDNPEVPTIIVNYDKEMALRAIIVAFTNKHATDVFASDRNSYDVSKFHSYDDVSGFLAFPDNKGTWIAKNSNTWRVENLKIVFEDDIFQNYATVNVDVSYDGTQYTISNISGESYLSFYDISEFEEDEYEYQLFFIVKNNMVEKDREPVTPLRMDIAMKAVEIVGERKYPYGFKPHWWFGREKSIQLYNGSWFFRVKTTITNMYGAERDVMVEAYINNITGDVENFKID